MKSRSYMPRASRYRLDPGIRVLSQSKNAAALPMGLQFTFVCADANPRECSTHCRCSRPKEGCVRSIPARMLSEPGEAQMKKQKLGRNGPEISVIGFGAWEAGGGFWGPGPEDEHVIKAMQTGFEYGMSWIDKAEGYGRG